MEKNNKKRFLIWLKSWEMVILFSFSDLIYDPERPFCVIDGELFLRELFKKGKADFKNLFI